MERILQSPSFVLMTHRNRTVCFMNSEEHSNKVRTTTQPVEHGIRLTGDPVGILLIHGLGGTPAEMKYVANGLARAGHTIHVPGLAGHCGSLDDLRAARWEDWYATVEREHETLRETCDRVIVGGLSMGAVLALHHAARQPRDVAGVLLYAPCLWLDGWAMPWYAPLINLVKQRTVADLFKFTENEPWGVKDQRVQAVVRQAMKSGDSSKAGVATLPGSQMFELRRLVKHVKAQIPRVRQPTLVIHPREDDHASLRNLEYLQAYLGGQTTGVVLDDSYHIVTIDQQRQVVVDRSVRFIAQLTKPPVPKLGPEDNLEWLSYRD
jgi:carboxylesterase